MLLDIEPFSMLSQAKRILVASNEPWGIYHSRDLASYYGDIPVVHIIPASSESLRLSGEDTSRAMPLSQVMQQSGDVLVLSGSEHWPGKVRSKFKSMPAISLRLAYLAPLPVSSLSHCDIYYASSHHHAVEMSEHFSVEYEKIIISPYPWKTESPHWQPEVGNILLVTSVSESGIEGNAAGNANDILYATACLLKSKGTRFEVSLHPRESPARWVEFEISSGPTLLAASKACAVIAVTGTVVEALYEMDVPLFLIPAPLAPAHLYRYGKVSGRSDELLELVSGSILGLNTEFQTLPLEPV